MPAATFTPVDDVVSQATSAGFFPGRHAVDVTDVRRLSDGVFRLTYSVRMSCAACRTAYSA